MADPSPPSTLHPPYRRQPSVIQRLEAQIDALKRENARLRASNEILQQRSIVTHFTAPPPLKMPPQETILLAALLKGGLKSKSHLLDILADHNPTPPGVKIVDVLVCRLRKHLRPHGVTITTVWSRGYMMTPQQLDQFYKAFPDAKR